MTRKWKKTASTIAKQEANHKAMLKRIDAGRKWAAKRKPENVTKDALVKMLKSRFGRILAPAYIGYVLKADMRKVPLGQIPVWSPVQKKKRAKPEPAPKPARKAARGVTKARKPRKKPGPKPGGRRRSGAKDGQFLVIHAGEVERFDNQTQIEDRVAELMGKGVSIDDLEFFQQTRLRLMVRSVFNV